MNHLLPGLAVRSVLSPDDSTLTQWPSLEQHIPLAQDLSPNSGPHLPASGAGGSGGLDPSPVHLL